MIARSRVVRYSTHNPPLRKQGSSFDIVDIFESITFKTKPEMTNTVFRMNV
jgi:hypothetical protein